MTEPVLVDTGPLVAVLSPRDAHHEQCAAELRGFRRPLVTCWPVLTEAAWLLGNVEGGVSALFGLIRSGVVEAVELGPNATARIPEFMDRYHSIGAQLADAALMHLAEERSLETVFTLDRRDFGVYRLKSGRALTIRPE